MLVSSSVPILTILLPGKLAPSRHIVEPQSPLRKSAYCHDDTSQMYIPEVGNDLVAAVGLLLVLLGGTLGDFELVRVIDTVGTVGATTDLAAVCAVAKDLFLSVSSWLYIEALDLHSLQSHLRPRSGRFRTYILRQPCLVVCKRLEFGKSWMTVLFKGFQDALLRLLGHDATGPLYLKTYPAMPIGQLKGSAACRRWCPST